MLSELNTVCPSIITDAGLLTISYFFVAGSASVASRREVNFWPTVVKKCVKIQGITIILFYYLIGI